MSSLTHASPVPLLDAARRVLRAVGLLPPDTAGMFLALADDLFGAWPRHNDLAFEAIGAAARHARGSARRVQSSRAFPVGRPLPDSQAEGFMREFAR